LKAVAPGSLYASVLTLAEIRRGIELLPISKRRTQLEEWLENELLESFGTNLLPVTRAIGDRWAVLSVRAQQRGTPLAFIDGLIAATALEHDLTLVTRNVRDFLDLGVSIFNPWEL
jgi:predicted nucleic acid-binding protein